MTTAIAYRLLLVQPRVVFAAQSSEITLAKDQADVHYSSVTTGAYTDIRPEMLVCFGSTPGADDLGRVRVRKPADAERIYFGWASRGKGEGEQAFAYGTHITVYDLYKPWTKNPRIDNDGTQFLDYDKDFATHHHSPPIVNLDCGTAVQRDLDPDTELATFEFNAIHTYMTDPDADAMYTDWLWELPAEATVTGGALDSHAITFTLPVGAWWVSAYETASTGAVGVRRVLCVAGEPDGTLRAFDQLEITRRPEGQTLRVRVSESVPESTYPNGCLCVLWKHQYEDGVEVTPSGLGGHEHIVFTGWHYSDEMDGRATERGYIDDTTLEFRDLGGWLQTLPGYPITMNRDQEPASWFEMKRANIDYAIARVLLMYSNACNLTDFHWSGAGYDHYPFPSLASQGSTLFEMVDYFARAIAHKLTCDQWNRLHIKPDPQLLDSAGGATPASRTTTVQKALTTADWSELRITETPFPRHNWNWGEAVVAKSVDADAQPQIDTVFCVAPGRAPSQGTATAQTGEQLTTTQAEFNARLGHAYARANTPTSGVEFTLTSPDDYAIQPAYMTWLTLSTSAATAGQRGRVYSAARVLPAEVSITHDAERGTQTVRVTAERETSGTPAATYYPPSNDYGDVPPWTPPDPMTPPASEWELGPGVNRLFLIHESGELSVTSTFLRTSSAGGPDYTVVDLSLDGTVLDAVTDPYSPLYLGTGTTVNAWVVTTERIYYVQDVAGVVGRVVTSQHTFASASDYRTIQTERGVRNWVIVASYYLAGGVKACRTTDGSTWTEVTVSSGIASGGGYSAPPGVSLTFTGGHDTPDPVYTQSLTLINDNFGVRASVTFSPGDWRNQGWNWYLATSGTITSLKIDVTAAGGLGVPFNDWAGEDPWTPRLYDGFSHIWPSGEQDIAGGKRYTYSGFSSSSLSPMGGYGNAYRAVPALNFPGGTYIWDVTIVEINGVSTLSSIGVRPALYVSGKAPGVAYIGAFVGGVGRLFKCTDYGATWFQTSIPASDFGADWLGGAFHFPWHDNASEFLYYWGKYDGSDYHAYRTEANGTTTTAITPVATFGPADPKAWSTSATNRNLLALMATDGTNMRGYLSQDGGNNWSYIVTEAARASSYQGVHVADDTGILYLWGGAGVAYTGAGGLSRDDRTGDASSSPVVAIGGW